MNRILAVLLLASGILHHEGCSGSRPEDEEHVITVYFVNDSREVMDLKTVTGPVPPIILYPVERTIVTASPEKAAVEQLLAGPRPDELSQGYSTALAGYRLTAFRIAGDTAYVDLEGSLKFPGLLAGPRLRAQVERTLRKFPTVRFVETSINDRSDFDSLK